MGTPAPDTVKRLVDHFDQDRKVFQSDDYKEEQLPAEFLNGPCLAVRHSDLASAAPVGQRVVRTSLGPFFTALGWDMDSSLDTIRTTNRGSVPLSPSFPRIFRVFLWSDHTSEA
jgi:hypothetical protein